MTTRGIRRKKSYLVDAKIAVCGQKSVGKSGKSPNIHACTHDDDDEIRNNMHGNFSIVMPPLRLLSYHRHVQHQQQAKMQMQKWKIFKWKANKSAFHNGFHVESLPFTRRYCRMSSTLFRSEKKEWKRNKRRMRFENVKNSLKRTEGGWRWEKMSVNMRKKIYELKKKSSFVSQVLSLIRRWEPRAHLELFFLPSLFVLRERWKSLRFGLRRCCCCVLFSSEITHVCLALLTDVWWWENICAQKVIKFTRATRAAFIISRDLVLCKFIIIQPSLLPLIALRPKNNSSFNFVRKKAEFPWSVRRDEKMRKSPAIAGESKRILRISFKLHQSSLFVRITKSCSVVVTPEIHTIPRPSPMRISLCPPTKARLNIYANCSNLLNKLETFAVLTVFPLSLCHDPSDNTFVEVEMRSKQGEWGRIFRKSRKTFYFMMPMPTRWTPRNHRQTKKTFVSQQWKVFFCSAFPRD